MRSTLSPTPPWEPSVEDVRVGAPGAAAGLVVTLNLQDDERAYLAYVARRIDHEVGLLHEGHQDPEITVQHIQQLAALAKDILGEDEVQGWLEAATRAPELSRL